MRISLKRSKEEEEEEDKPKPRRRRKKEPPKPWGRAERLLVGFVLIGTAVIASLLAFSAREWKLPGLPRLSLPKISTDETFILDKQDNPDESFDKIQSDFKKAVADLSGIYGLYVSGVNTDISYGVNEDEIFEAASFIKLPVLAALYIEAQEGGIDLETKYSLKATDKIAGAGSLYDKPEGTIVTYRELAELMGQESDNTAFGIVRERLGDDKIEKVMEDMGMRDTSLDQNETTPGDIGVFFEKLWQARIVSRESRNEILEYLTGTLYEAHLVAGVPEDIRVAHKYGREVHVINDAGIVFAKNPFIVVIMSKGVVEAEADTIFPELSRIIFEFESSN